jgi:hypothetical protein
MIHECDKEEQRRIVGMAVGDFVMYADVPDKMQVHWGGHNHPDKAGMALGEVYKVADVEIHDSYTHIMFDNIVGKFNHISFAKVDPLDTVAISKMRKEVLERSEMNKSKLIEEFTERANKWFINIQKCGLNLLIDCCDCGFYENCQTIREQLGMMQDKLIQHEAMKRNE